jgi:retron-type reverse transcriptase
MTGLSAGVRRSFTTAGCLKTTLRGNGNEETPKRVLNIKEISNFKNLVVAYELIKSKPGNMTPGADPSTLDGVSLDFLRSVQQKLRAGKFNFPAARRIQIPKPGKPNETRPLTIASPRDKIVQKAMLLGMEGFYNSKFLDTSHGFRPGMGTHTAIQYVESKFNSCKYIIEADFSKAFDTINHKKLIEIISRDCNDDKLKNLI